MSTIPVLFQCDCHQEDECKQYILGFHQAASASGMVGVDFVHQPCTCQSNCAARLNESRQVVLVFSLVCVSIAQDSPRPASATHPSGDSTDPDKISVKVNVVNVLGTVRDKHGKIVNNLGQDDFALTEDGRPQSIHYFSRETDPPLTLGLLVNTSRSQRRVLDQGRSASYRFLDQVVREARDRAFLIHFDREVELLHDQTEGPDSPGSRRLLRGQVVILARSVACREQCGYGRSAPSGHCPRPKPRILSRSNPN